MIDKEIEEAKQESFVQYNSNLYFEEDLIEKSMESLIAYEKLVHMLKYADKIMFEFHELKQWNVLEQIKFQEFLVGISSDGFQNFYFVLQQVHLSKEHVKFLEKDEN